jgi:hypothetical protein
VDRAGLVGASPIRYFPQSRIYAAAACIRHVSTAAAHTTIQRHRGQSPPIAGDRGSSYSGLGRNILPRSVLASSLPLLLDCSVIVCFPLRSRWSRAVFKVATAWAGQRLNPEQRGQIEHESRRPRGEHGRPDHLRMGAMLVGHQACGTCRGSHSTWTCFDCGSVCMHHH